MFSRYKIKPLSILMVALLLTGSIANAQPIISSLSAGSGRPGSAVTITGTNFNTTAANNIVCFGATRATVSAASATSLTVTVPMGATYMPVSVNNRASALTGYSDYPFLPTFDNSAYIPGTVYFNPNVDFPAGSYPSSVAIGDLDGDDKPDLAVVNYYDNTVSVYRNTSAHGTIDAGSFAAKVDFATEGNPRSVAIGDLDGDGKPDLAVANDGFSMVSIFRNTSVVGVIDSGSFAAAVYFDTRPMPISIAIGDLDGDGKPDLAVASLVSSRVSIFRNTGTTGSIDASSFAARVDLNFGVGSNLSCVTIGDLDGDGKPDLAVANSYSNTVSVSRNTSTPGSISSGSFAPKVDFAVGTYPYNVAIGDLDGDGKPDLAVANYWSNTVSVLRNTSIFGSIAPGSFATKVDFAVGDGPNSVAIGDLDGDGKPDLTVANQYSSTVSVLRNTSAAGSISPGSFAANADFATGTHPIICAVIGDLDADGKPDLAVANYDVSGSVSVIKNNALVQPPTISSVSSAASHPGSAVTITGTNFNTSAASNIVYFGATKATVSAASATSLTAMVPLGATYMPVSVNNTALALSGYSRYSFLPTFDNSAYISDTVNFSPNVNFPAGSGTQSVAIGDLDGDGKPDLAVANGYDNTVSVYRNTSAFGSITPGSFAAAVDFATGANSYSVAIGDLDGDGKPDLAVSNGWHTVSVFRNTSASGSIDAGSFAAAVDFDAGGNPFCVAIGDLDGDGKPDLVTANNGWIGTVSVLRNTSASGSIDTSSFAAAVDFTTGNYPISVAIGDLDGDGKPDLAVATQFTNKVSVFRNMGTPGIISSGFFAAKVDFATGSNPFCVAIGDLDGDGKSDLAIANSSSNTVSVLRNTSTSGSIDAGSFATNVDFATGGNPHCVALGDLDGDGRPDLAVANYSSATVSVLRNTSAAGSISSGSFAAKVDFATGGGSYSVVIGDLDGDGKPDLALANFDSNAVTVIRNNPLTSITGATSVCQGSNTTLSGPTPGGSWSSSDSSVATVGFATGVVSGVAAGSATISYTTTGGTTTKVVTVSAPPNAGIIVGSTTLCAGAAMFFSDSASGGTWSSSNTGIASVDSSGVVSGVANGTATISYTVSGACGSATATKVVTVNATPTAGTILGSSSVAAGSTITLSNTVSGGSWSASNGNATVSAVGIVTGVAAGSVVISYTVSSSCGTASVIKGITITSAVGGSTGALSICAGQTTTLSNGTPGGTWSSNNTSIATISAGGVVAGISPGMATISYTTSIGVATSVVTVNYTPTAITGTMAICAGAITTLNNEGADGGSWTSSNTTVASIGSNTGYVSGASVGTTIVTYMLPTGCNTTAVVTINALPGAITGTASVCAGATTALGNGTVGGTWSSTATSVATVDSNGVVTGVGSGMTTITYALGTGCKTTTTVTVYALPATITGVTSVCAGAITNLSTTTLGGSWNSSNASVTTVGTSGSVTGIAPGTADIAYTTGAGCTRSVTVTVNEVPVISGVSALCANSSLTISGSIPGGTWSGGNTTVAVIASGVVSGIGAGTTNFTYTVTSGCKASTTVTVNPAPAAITGTLKACPGASTTLNCATTGGVWTSSDPTIATAGSSSGIISGIVPGTVTVTYTSAAGCYRTATVTINVSPAPIAGTFGTCIGSTTSLSDPTPGLSWSSSNAAVATIASTGVVTGVGMGTATITYAAGTTNCYVTAQVSVNGVPATIGGPATGCVGTSVTLTNTVAGGAWSSASTGIATVDPSTGVVTGVGTGIATISYSTGAGCSKIKFVTINSGATITGNPLACVGLTTTLAAGSGTWASGDPSIATIVPGGYVTAVSVGTALITFTAASTSCSSTVVVTVVPVPAAITGATTACQGSIITMSDVSAGGTWASSNTAVATVGSATGIVTAVGSGGTATISYIITSTCRATTTFSPKAVPAVIGGTATVCSPMTTTLTDVSAGGTWSSSDVSIATVGSVLNAGTGVVTGISGGTVDITYTLTATGCSRSTTVTVNAGLNPGTITSSGGFTLHTVSAPTSVTLSSTGAPGGTWTSSNPAVATVNAATGVVSAVAAGTTTITYTVTNSCANSTTKVITVTAGRPISSVQSAVGSVQLYPNPTTGAFTLVAEEAGAMNLFSIDGKEITSYGISAGINALNLPKELASGVYMCKYTSESGNTTMVRLVYER